jgi:hypothetical protein
MITAVEVIRWHFSVGLLADSHANSSVYPDISAGSAVSDCCSGYQQRGVL